MAIAVAAAISIVGEGGLARLAGYAFAGLMFLLGVIVLMRGRRERFASHSRNPS